MNNYFLVLLSIFLMCVSGKPSTFLQMISTLTTNQKSNLLSACQLKIGPLQTKKKPTSKKIVKTIQKQTLINNFLLQENFCKTKTIRFLRKFSTNFSLPPSKNNVLSTFEDFFLNLKKKIICKNGFTLQFAAPPLAKKNLKIFSARVRLCKTKNRLEEKKI